MENVMRGVPSELEAMVEYWGVEDRLRVGKSARRLIMEEWKQAVFAGRHRPLCAIVQTVSLDYRQPIALSTVPHWKH